MPARQRPHKQAKRKRSRPAALVRRAAAMPQGPMGGSALAPAPSTRFDASDWPVGPCWATRVDHVGSQAVFLSRPRPGAALAMVSAVVNDRRGIVDGGGNESLTPSDLEALAKRLSGPVQSAYRVPPEYVLYRVRVGEQAGGLLHRPHRDFRAWSHLLVGLEEYANWEPPLEALQAERARPDELPSTEVLVHSVQFFDWWFAPEDSREVRALLDDVDAALAKLEDGGVLSSPDLARLPEGLELLTETHYLTAPWPLTDAGTAAVEPLIDKHLPRVLPGDTVRYREWLLQMGYLTDLADQVRFSRLILTAAWGLDEGSGVSPTDHPFLRAILRKTVEHHVLG